jgi:hypothetical protein
VALVADSGLYVHISWFDVADEAAYRIEKRAVNDTVWVPITYRPRQETGAVVSFNGPAPAHTNPGGHGDDAFDGHFRDMNPKVWCDYLKTPGNYFYRVVAVGCGDLNVAASDSVPIEVVANHVKIKSETNLKAYPVPSQDLVHFVWNGKMEKAQLYDGTGREIRTIPRLPSETLSLSVNQWKPGIYFLKISNSETSKMVRFVVE